MSFDPCREWLGIPAVDLVSAHAVLGVSPGETDPTVIAAGTCASAPAPQRGEVDRMISVVEIGPETYAYKEAGRIHRRPRASMPKAFERAIVRQWFDADGRAANHILLGVQLLLDEKPSLPAVRDEWETALAGESATASILPLLDDPILAGVEE